MMGPWTEPGFTKSGRGIMGITGSIATWLGVIFVILGAIGEVRESIIGLYPTSWYLIAIASLIFSLGCWLGWAIGIYLHAKEAK